MNRVAPTGTPGFSVLGAPQARLPACAGVYRFLDSNGYPLYIGKSINIYARVRTHLNEARHSQRQQRMVSATASVDCRPTAGEAGALLLENLAIKRDVPLFNRSQRAVRRLWSILLKQSKTGYEQAEIQAFTLDKPDIMAAYGSFKSRHHAREALRELARSESLCPKILGLEHARGACFQRQLGHCAGACVGIESADVHNQRLRAALARHRLSAWPVVGPVLVRETCAEPVAGQPRQEWHLLHNWTYLGTFSSEAAAAQAGVDNTFMFDRDTYQILRRVLRTHKLPLYCADSGEAVNWPDSGVPV
ncbi:GIY-YIG nuclease family protein [Candidatus Litorirhabdus singularis]|uniref:GIY-YIG nuclease family protein n=1 Tax=Candidatus Litorirhabdus singularis TaxID=2518993 RepID=UPI00242F4C57|nr:GIY-YIG nuclease family protein [Candidatus Litorirhabdus singularis]